MTARRSIWFRRAAITAVTSWKKGTSAYKTQSGETTGLIAPLAKYDHSAGASLTGGHICRGDIDGLNGDLIYGDVGPGRIRRLVDVTSNRSGVYQPLLK